MRYFILLTMCMTSVLLMSMQKEQTRRQALFNTIEKLRSPNVQVREESYLQLLPIDIQVVLKKQLVASYDRLFLPCFYVLQGHTGPITSVSLSCDGSWALTGSHDATARFWDLRDGKSHCFHRLQGHSGGITSVALTPDGSNGIVGFHCPAVGFVRHY